MHENLKFHFKIQEKFSKATMKNDNLTREVDIELKFCEQIVLKTKLVTESSFIYNNNFFICQLTKELLSDHQTITKNICSNI